jgi:hypothetical protein
MNMLLMLSLFVWLVADGWCWFVLREKYCWLIVGDWFILREKYCWLVADKPSEQGAMTMEVLALKEGLILARQSGTLKVCENRLLVVHL